MSQHGTAWHSAARRSGNVAHRYRWNPQGPAPGLAAAWAACRYTAVDGRQAHECSCKPQQQHGGLAARCDLRAQYNVLRVLLVALQVLPTGAAAWAHALLQVQACAAAWARALLRLQACAALQARAQQVWQVPAKLEIGSVAGHPPPESLTNRSNHNQLSLAARMCN